MYTTESPLKRASLRDDLLNSCPKTGAFGIGIAITSSSICVASRCAWVGPLGAVATQNVTDPALGPAGLALLRQGLGAGAALQLLLAGTPDPAWRQVGVIDRYGQIALHSDTQALSVAAVAKGEESFALDNLLASADVPQCDDRCLSQRGRGAFAGTSDARTGSRSRSRRRDRRRACRRIACRRRLRLAGGRSARRLA